MAICDNLISGSDGSKVYRKTVKTIRSQIPLMNLRHKSETFEALCGTRELKGVVKSLFLSSDTTVEAKRVKGDAIVQDVIKLGELEAHLNLTDLEVQTTPRKIGITFSQTAGQSTGNCIPKTAVTPQRKLLPLFLSDTEEELEEPFVHRHKQQSKTRPNSVELAANVVPEQVGSTLKCVDDSDSDEDECVQPISKQKLGRPLTRRFSDHETQLLIRAIRNDGVGNWRRIQEKYFFLKLYNRSVTSLKIKPVHWGTKALENAGREVEKN
ncbi:hypothetical protein BWQ96_05975 [Gracilariopsis chorda]|uniref:Myb-like domain-containing protein n=1 Tax=Gracilariopsis chorda TaxID=448386 RepID=A0A2V3IQ97_9FLOR|nr:hypothetical protein BWQ96_05975 [Gracilariopsis chorda]|eukprot:PXF44271.1 hypothetical protein BWQ96_05975 [Gracilariopsis chorda]